VIPSRGNCRPVEPKRIIKFDDTFLSEILASRKNSDLDKRRLDFENSNKNPTRTSYFPEMATDSFFLPFARRLFMTRRPFFVDIRTRKPWVLLREILLG
jgi:hypothetical protein